MEFRTSFPQRHDGPTGPRGDSSDGSLRILIVDDDADTSDTMAILLEHWGFQPLAVRNGSEALQASDAHSPDLILLDIGMPGMDGLELARRLRQQVPPRAKAPFLIAVSGYGDAQTCQRAREAGIDLHLVKPVDPLELEKLLRRFQQVVMPGAERKLPAFHRRPRLLSSLRHWSDRAILRRRLTTAVEIVGTARELTAQFRMTKNPQERAALRAAWCAQAASFLDESETIRGLLFSFQKWGMQATTDA